MEVSYILEVIIGGVATRSFALPLVTNATLQRTPTTVLTWTLGKEPLREFAGIREQTVQLQGRSGIQFRRGQSADGTALYDDGPSLFRELEQFIRDYEEECHNYQQRLAPARVSDQSPPRLALRALWEEVDLLVEHKNFSWTRDVASSRHSYTWALNLMAYGKPERGNQPAVADVFRILDTATRAINTVSSYVVQATEFLQDTRSTLDRFREPVKAVFRVAREVRNLASAAQSIRAWPQDFAADAFRVSAESTQALYDVWAATPFFDRAAVRSSMIRAMAPMSEVRRDVLEWMGLNFIRVGGGSLPETPESATTTQLALTGQTPVTQYDVLPGQDLQDVALAVTGDRGQWKTIQALNGMSSPEIMPDGTPLGPGVTLLVPSGEDTAALGADPYGTDLALGPDGDLVVSGDPAVDVATITGPPNLRQALTLRALTTQGTNQAFPQHGFPPALGEAGVGATAGLLASHARSQFARDPRIRRVKRTEVQDAGDTYRVSALLQTFDGQSFPATVPVIKEAG